MDALCEPKDILVPNFFTMTNRLLQSLDFLLDSCLEVMNVLDGDKLSEALSGTDKRSIDQLGFHQRLQHLPK